VLAYGTFVPLMKIGCCLILLFVKSICTDFDSLSFIRHFLFLFVEDIFSPCIPSASQIHFSKAHAPAAYFRADLRARGGFQMSTLFLNADLFSTWM
jgi:hypothetical protein